MSSKSKILLFAFSAISALQTHAQQPQMPTSPAQPVESRANGLLSLPMMNQIPPSAPTKYRDPSVPLTIGEMSDMSARKAQADFLQRQGFSTNEPVKIVSSTPSKKSMGIEALAIWGGSKSQAELSVNGRVIRVQGGEVLAPGVQVHTVQSSSVQIIVEKPKSKRKQADPEIRTIQAGQTIEVTL